jgi:hypothetical protein
MSRSVAVIAVLACFAVAILTACGSDDSGSSTANNAVATSAETTAPAATETPAPTATTTETAPAASTTSPKSTDKATVVASCHKVFDPLLAQLHKIEATVDGTPRFVAYRAATNKLLADYRTFKASSIPSTSCLTAVSVPTTQAYLAHLGAANAWLACRKDDKCAKTMPEIKKEWRKARKLIAKADRGFESVTPN